MFKHKIFDLLRTFTPDEIKKFDEFIKSPYFNKKIHTIGLYQEIINYYPGFDAPKLSRRTLYKKILHSDNYKDSTLRVLIANLQNLAMQFLAFENFKKEKLNIDSHMLEEMLIRDQGELFLRHIRKINAELKEPKDVDFEYLSNRYIIERSKFNFGIAHDKIIRKTNVYRHVESIYNTCNYLNIFYITELITQYIDCLYTGKI
jgi:hypothetical protein